ncbi:YihY/virulence factor BrkB family protein [Abyssalbus ytuae]|uniref:YihY/virulence factor BrkB family protein n=1 Tax=Abyssalbus ytuae TaxID=2926907 RepID=A0A9E6ZMD9_9FLAO|nr:YihY/virulence factor BrkB family protein [Abyssalbus ytuae]UOB18482.1 YihY/virulence factor BrkB family protein [Abyssalbus ytuae]
MKINFKKIWKASNKFVAEFLDADPFLHSASISFYTLFSLPAVMFIMVQIASYFWGQEAVTQQLYSEISKVVGSTTAGTLQEILANVEAVKSNVWRTIWSISLLLIGTTTVFISIQKGLNSIWNIYRKPQNNLLRILYDRLRSFTTVIALGFLIVVSLLSDTVLLLLMDYLKRIIPEVTVYLLQAVNWILSMLLTSILFSYIFIILPHAKIPWKSAFYGGVITSILFFVGRFLISFYIATSSLNTVYGAAGSLALILIWVYYSSLILLLGGKITEMKYKEC